MQGRDFVIIGIQAWDIGIGSNCKNIALEISKNNRVLYVNPPLDRITKIKDKNSPEVKKRISVINGASNGLQQINDNLWTLYPSRLAESINWIPVRLIYNLFNKINSSLFFREINEFINKLNFKNIILFNDSSMFLGYYANEYLRPSYSIYYIRDYLVMQSYFKKHGEKMEPLLAKKYDLVVSNSIYLADYLKPYNPNTYMVGQGCDLSKFDLSVEINSPEDLAKINKPIIGYVGFLTSLRLDIELMVYLATNRPEYNFVLVGPEDDDFKNSELHRLQNVYFLGSKNEDELSAYVNGFTVAINPQIVNLMTIGNYPRKIDEYLAMGKPTVATETTAMAYFKEYVYLGKDSSDFLSKIDQAIDENSQELVSSRISFAHEHTWEESVHQIFRLIGHKN